MRAFALGTIRWGVGLGIGLAYPDSLSLMIRYQER